VGKSQTTPGFFFDTLVIFRSRYVKEIAMREIELVVRRFLALRKRDKEKDLLQYVVSDVNEKDLEKKLQRDVDFVKRKVQQPGQYDTGGQGAGDFSGAPAGASSGGGGFSGFSASLDVKSAVAIVINNNGEILLGKYLLPSDRQGKWCFPGGTLEPGETTKLAAARECLEETGVHAIPLSSLGTTDQAEFILCQEVDSNDMQPNEEFSDLEWFTPEEVITREDVYQQNRDLVVEYFNPEVNPTEVSDPDINFVEDLYDVQSRTAYLFTEQDCRERARQELDEHDQVLDQYLSTLVAPDMVVDSLTSIPSSDTWDEVQGTEFR